MVYGINAYHLTHSKVNMLCYVALANKAAILDLLSNSCVNSVEYFLFLHKGNTISENDISV